MPLTSIYPRLRNRTARLLIPFAILLPTVLAPALPARADDASDYTVTVSASVSPTSITTGQSATGSATASISGNNTDAAQEIADYNPSPQFSIASVAGQNSGDTPPSATISSDGSDLTVNAGSNTTADEYTVTIQATYTWTDSDGVVHAPSGTATVTVTVVAPSYSIAVRLSGTSDSFGPSCNVAANSGGESAADVQITATDAQGNPLRASQLRA